MPNPATVTQNKQIHQDYAYHRNGIALADAVGVEDRMNIVLASRNVDSTEHIVHPVVVDGLAIDGSLPSISEFCTLKGIIQLTRRFSPTG